MVSTAPTRGARWALSAASERMSLLVSMTTGPAVWLSAPQVRDESVTRTAPSLIEYFTAVSLIEVLLDRDRLQHVALALRQRIELAGDFACRNCLLRHLARQGLGEIVEIPRRSASPVAAACRSACCGRLQTATGRQGLRYPLSVPLQMHRQQNLLHDILGLVGRLPGPRQAAPRGSAQRRRDRLQQAMIRRVIACHGRPHQAGPARPHVRARAPPSPCNSAVLSVCYAGGSTITNS